MLTPRLFIEIDDVLIMWGSSVIEVDGTEDNIPWRKNRKLIVEIRRFQLKFPKALITLWGDHMSQDEVRVWRDRVGLYAAVPLEKKEQLFRTLVREGDIVVDVKGAKAKTHSAWDSFADEARLLDICTVPLAVK